MSESDSVSTEGRYQYFLINHAQMKDVCLLNLDEGKAKNWQRSLKETIADRFIQNSQELQDVIRSKAGLWSTIKGFCQWLYWLFVGGNT